MSVIKKYTENYVVPDVSRLKVLKCDGSGTTYIYKEKEYSLSLCGEYQIENSLTAIEAVSASGFNIPYETVKKALGATFFPARLKLSAEIRLPCSTARIIPTAPRRWLKL